MTLIITQYGPEEIKFAQRQGIRFDQFFIIRTDDYEYKGKYVEIGDWCIENLQENYVYLSMFSRIEAGGYGSPSGRSIEDLKKMNEPKELYGISLRNMELRCSDNDALLFKLTWMNKTS